MAIQVHKAEELNKAIVDKVEKVLANTDCPTDVKIMIEAKVGTAPLINYQIEEFIVVEEGEK